MNRGRKGGRERKRAKTRARENASQPIGGTNKKTKFVRENAYQRGREGKMSRERGQMKREASETEKARKVRLCVCVFQRERVLCPELIALHLVAYLSDDTLDCGLDMEFFSPAMGADTTEHVLQQRNDGLVFLTTLLDVANRNPVLAAVCNAHAAAIAVLVGRKLHQSNTHVAGVCDLC